MNRDYAVFAVVISLVVVAVISIGSVDTMTGRVTIGSDVGTQDTVGGIIKYDEPPCYSVGGISFSDIPDENQLQYISIIKPEVFGVITFYPDLERVRWINNLEPETLGYEFKKFYGSTQFQNLVDLKAELSNIDIVGYCPLLSFEPLEEATLSERIDLLEDIYPDKEILIGPCIDLFDKVRTSVNKPDYLGFELLEKDFDDYLQGKYDDLINAVISQRVDIDAYISVGKETDLEKLKKVLNKVSSDNIDIGYMIDGDKRILDFILQRRCR